MFFTVEGIRGCKKLAIANEIAWELEKRTGKEVERLDVQFSSIGVGLDSVIAVSRAAYIAIDEGKCIVATAYIDTWLTLLSGGFKRDLELDISIMDMAIKRWGLEQPDCIIHMVPDVREVISRLTAINSNSITNSLDEKVCNSWAIENDRALAMLAAIRHERPKKRYALDSTKGNAAVSDQLKEILNKIKLGKANV